LTIKFKTKIDKFGRIVIPKKIRNDFGLKNNTEVEVEATSDNIIVRPKPSNPFVIDKDGILVVCSEPLEPFTDFLQENREDRVKRVTGDIKL